MFDEEITAKAAQTLQLCRQAGMMIITAESCTGGLVSAALTAIAGSSDAVEGGFVTYSNEAKQRFLGISEAGLRQYGAVSEPIARAMAEGAIIHSDANLSVSLTGIAGPGGGTKDKPVGLVHLATARRDGPTRHLRMVYCDLDRNGIRLAALHTALELLQKAATET